MRLFNFTVNDCKNCYKCIRVCPVKALRFRGNKAEIDEDRCIACGQCFVVCPKNARNVENDIEKVINAIKEGIRVVACLDSSYLGVFDEPGRFVAALKKLGFSSVQENAVGAEILKEKYKNYIIDNAETKKYIISSTCPTVYLFIQKYHPELIQYLIPIVSPMLAIGKAIKKEDRDCFTVYIGPCLGRKYEISSAEDHPIDAHITFPEIIKMLKWNFIDYENIDPELPDRRPERTGRNYSISGDMWKDMTRLIRENGYDALSIYGLDHVKNLFTSMEEGTLEKSYVGISACHESCLNGPFIPQHSKDIYCRRQKLKKYAANLEGGINDNINWDELDLSCSFKDDSIDRLKANEEEIATILSAMGKHKRSDELNCGACGYNTCREKSQAVFEGMAEIEMCMPYMRERAEKMTDTIFLNSRNMIFVTDEKLNIKRFNPAAEKAFQISHEFSYGKPISIILDDDDFVNVIETGKDVLNKKVKLNPYGIIALETVVYLEKEKEVIITMQDITEDEKRRQELDDLRMKTVDIAQNVIDKQMRVAHEIASLLGETTAETKIALNKLKDVVMEEGE
ncbi:MAG: 4Fe-4S dicluster domain-containing protein [Lachnospiraceae bacterium]|nr:4Fe-4S dicluster domain-containing protein [Lachnospiraceae bacterium]